MIAIHTTSHIGSDGRLVLEVQTALRDAEVEVMVVLQPVVTPTLDEQQPQRENEAGTRG